MNVQGFYTYIHVSFCLLSIIRAYCYLIFFCCKAGSNMPYAPPRSAQSLLSRLR